MLLTIGVMIGVAGTTAYYTGADPVKSIGSSLVSGALVTTIRNPRVTYNFVKPFARPVAQGAWAIGRDVIVRPALAAGRSFAASPTAAFAAAAAAGYVLGSTGTVVASGALEKKGYVRAGTTDSLIDFYTFGITESGGTPARDRSKWYESDKPILNIPGDVAYIGRHYWNKAF